jgi:hypothetical protein
MTAVMVGAGQQRRRSGASPRFSAYGIGSSRVCGESYSTAIIGLFAPTTPLYLCGAARRGGSTAIHGKRPRSGHGLNWFLNFGDLSKKEGDHIPNIPPLDLHISY